MGRIADALKRAAGGGITRPADGLPIEGPGLELFLSDRSPASVTGPWKFEDERENPRYESAASAATPPAPADDQVLRVISVPARPELWDSAVAKRLVLSRELSDFAREQYRRLGAILHEAQLERGAKIVMVTSALAGEGKTLTAANLALTLDESFRRRVGLFEADLRRPTMHQLFDLDGAAAGQDALTTNGPVSMAQVRPRLSVLAQKGPVADPLAALSSDRMGQILNAARARFDWVVMDTPPVGLVPDASVLAHMVDAVVLVVAAGRTPWPAVRRAIDALGSERVIGVVLNRADERAVRQRATGYHNYYGSSLHRASPGNGGTGA